MVKNRINDFEKFVWISKFMHLEVPAASVKQQAGLRISNHDATLWEDKKTTRLFIHIYGVAHLWLIKAEVFFGKNKKNISWFLLKTCELLFVFSWRRSSESLVNVFLLQPINYKCNANKRARWCVKLNFKPVRSDFCHQTELVNLVPLVRVFQGLTQMSPAASANILSLQCCCSFVCIENDRKLRMSHAKA